MLLWIALIAVGTYIAAKNGAFDRNPDNQELPVANFFMVPLVAGVFGFIILMFASLMLPSIDVPDERIQLIALNRSEPQISGRAFLGSGYIETGRAWEYIEYYPEEGYDHPDVVPLYSRYYTVHNYRDQPAGSDSAYLIKYKKAFAYDWFKYIVFFPSDRGPTLYEFHTPSDSIIPEVDIQP
jgi:hypothetical protein